ncbi:glycosyltransferase family protein [Pedobacter zeae]|uniref:Glycosyltransferase involved in cell wall biosynthesis n=1 Tax=Pedobacter zeae TaxID=1737356 RepID=A0A7W6K9P3_9SPHI|nr:hypothetical protein [Pedobacter zeae]MBB4107790.1 glycosyltransferase involved in cell wall biosynthesis [Pedobacter zeae]GGG97033.1 hypothetical protein GCM10007422_08650 [Pedobacter zeae]
MDSVQSKTICLITPGHICSDPRIVKEAIAISDAGFHVHVIFTQYVAELIAFDQQILIENPKWTYNVLNWTGVSPISKAIKLFYGFKQKISRFLLPNRILSLNRNYSWQLKKAIAIKANLYIGHNIGALPVTVNAAKKNGVRCGFDAEDFHRNEITNDTYSPEVKLKCAIEDEFIPKLNYLSAASPLIAAQYQKLYSLSVTPILNVFPKIDRKISFNQQAPLKLFWFSQTIGPGRGLENIFDALKLILFDFEFHLVGKVSPIYKNDLLQKAGLTQQNKVIFHGTVSIQTIFEIASRCDIGLASEIPYPLNRNICLTNKIFTYIQCGLLVLASDTRAQLLFMKDHAQVGKIYRGVQDLSRLITYYHENRAELQTTKKASYELGQNSLNWEIESKKILTIIQDNVGK